MSEPITADWNVFGNTLYLGEIGAPYVAFPGAMDDAQTIAAAHNDALAALRRRAELAEAEAAMLRQAHADAWILIGRCDFAFELVTTALSLSIARKAARQLRSEIKQASQGGDHA